uniref:PAM2 domain-containing protein n=1 Tax=Mesocestoides corti TaxID=53468 RepID=A0A5K3FGH5_MESCO
QTDEPRNSHENGSEVAEEQGCKENHFTTVVNPQAYEDWPEFEVVEPLRHQAMPKPVQVKNEIQAVAARGDSPDVSELLQKMPGPSKCQVSNAPKPSTVVTNFIREVFRAESGEASEQNEYEPQLGIPQPERTSSRSSGGASRLNRSAPQEHTAGVKKRSIQTNRSCHHPVSTVSKPKTDQDGNHRALKKSPKAQQSARISRKVPPVWPKYQTPRSLLYRLVTTEKDFFMPSQEDSNNTNSSTSSAAQAGTRLASTLFQSHLKPISPNPGNAASSQSAKQTTRTAVLPEIPRKNGSDDK